MNAIYAKRAIKAMERMDSLTKQRIRQKIEAIPAGDIKYMKGHTELYRLRVGDWRIVFSYADNETVIIEKISPRGDVYKGW